MQNNIPEYSILSQTNDVMFNFYNNIVNDGIPYKDNKFLDVVNSLHIGDLLKYKELGLTISWEDSNNVGRSLLFINNKFLSEGVFSFLAEFDRIKEDCGLTGKDVEDMIYAKYHGLF